MSIFGDQVSHTPVFFSGRFLAQRVSGVQRFAEELILAVDRLLARNTSSAAELPIYVVTPKNIIRELDLKRIRKMKVGVGNGLVWEQAVLPAYTRRGILVCLSNAGPILHKKRVTAVHDVAVVRNPKNFSRAYRVARRAIITDNLRASRVIITVSAFSKREIADAFPWASPDVRVIPNGADHILRANPDRSSQVAHRLERGRYIFALGGASVNKNIGLVLRAMQKVSTLSLQIVLAGEASGAAFYKNEEPEDGRVLKLGYVSDGEIRALYEGALCFVFPSLYEGFGIPPLEAMLCGCPVVVSDIPALRETCGDAALYCDPYDPTSLSEHLFALATSPHLRESLINSGYARARMFTWDRSGRLLMGVIREAAGYNPLINEGSGS